MNVAAQKRIQVLIVDDEPLARRTIRTLLEHEDQIEIAGECKNGYETIEAIRELPLDLVFLDVQMPEMNAFEVLDVLDADPLPAIIFVTAYDQYALRAFEVHAVDYLLKPFDDERFKKALSHARYEILHKHQNQLNHQMVALLEDYKHQRKLDRKYLERIPVRTQGRIYFVPVEEIDWIEASDQYVLIHAGKESHMIRESLNHLETQLMPERFFRLHRSAVVNLHRVKEIQVNKQGEGFALLRDGTLLKISRSRRASLEDALTSFSQPPAV